MNIEIPPPEGKTQTPFKSAMTSRVRTTATNARGQAFTSHRQELTSPKYPLKTDSELFDAAVTPITLLRIRNVDDDGRNEEETPYKANDR